MSNDFDAAFDAAKGNPPAIPDGTYVYEIKDSGIDIDRDPHVIWFKVYYPALNRWEYARFRMGTKIDAEIIKRTLKLIDPNVTSSNINTVVTAAIGGTGKLSKKTKTKDDKSYPSWFFSTYEQKGSSSANIPSDNSSGW